MSPEPPDPMDDVLDELLRGADEDLRESLGRTLYIRRGRYSITGVEPDRPLRKSRSVEDCINRLEAVLTEHNCLWRWNFVAAELDELRKGLAMHWLSRDDANQLIDKIASKVDLKTREAVLSTTQQRHVVDPFFEKLTELRVAVARLFDDSRDGSVLR